MNIDILLVEDNPGDVRLIQEAFKTVDRSTSIHAVTTSREALDFLSERAATEPPTLPDVLLLDLNLPGSNGFTVLEEVRENQELAHLPVLILTSSTVEKDVQRSYKLRANAYLRKPDNPDQYEALAQRVVDFWFYENVLPHKQ
ncbi:response regulator [Halorarum halophilum]|uniref:Response regulator n=1 Tax=Halorarum halophilum TaxID=2743090 RepID=A0A7D5GG72_9EURY|nr:response regulator [Halobaculum halophilum]QLG26571.1 response regulator [Halobaculum halophilum]